MSRRSKEREDELPLVEPNRREMLEGMVRCGCAAALVSMTGCTFAEVYGDLEATSVTFDLREPEFAALREVGGMVPINEGAWRTILVRRTENEIIGLDRMCPHEWCDMLPGTGGMWFEDSLMCLCHGSRFAIDGTVMTGPAVDNIPSYRVQYDGESQTGTVFLEIQELPSSDEAGR
jgi:Rieske Fe-S protein